MRRQPTSRSNELFIMCVHPFGARINCRRQGVDIGPEQFTQATISQDIASDFVFTRQFGQHLFTGFILLALAGAFGVRVSALIFQIRSRQVVLENSG